MDAGCAAELLVTTLLSTVHPLDPLAHRILLVPIVDAPEEPALALQGDLGLDDIDACLPSRLVASLVL
eukprot:13921795-Alexandrium_andersonii.AAC.1